MYILALRVLKKLKNTHKTPKEFRIVVNILFSITCLIKECKKIKRYIGRHVLWVRNIVSLLKEFNLNLQKSDIPFLIEQTLPLPNLVFIYLIMTI